MGLTVYVASRKIYNSLYNNTNTGSFRSCNTLDSSARPGAAVKGTGKPGKQPARSAALNRAGPCSGRSRGARFPAPHNAGTKRDVARRESESNRGTEVALGDGAGSGKGRGRGFDEKEGAYGSGSGVVARGGKPVKRRRPAKRVYTAETLISPWEAAEAAAEAVEAGEKLRSDVDDANHMLVDINGN